MLDNLSKYRILLASKSPRRSEMLRQMQVPFELVTLKDIDESYPDDLPVLQVASYIASKKAEAYKVLLKDRELIITADTVVICDGQLMGKPHSVPQAVEMLMALSDKTHQVITGVNVMTKEKSSVFDVTTHVTFAPMTRYEVEYYVSNFHPLDKAGAYGIQEWIGGVAVKSIMGSFYNVMGLPIHQLYSILRQF